MKIELSKIKASSKPIRSSWDEAKMNDLKWSLMEEGQVEPIGVHENGNGYVIVWGHRRTEAARRAAWTEIEAVVVPQDEVDNLIQAGIENLAGEDMSVDDKAEWAFRLTEMGLSKSEISRRSTVPTGTIEMWMVYKREKNAGITAGSKSFSQDEGMRKVVNVARVLGNDIEAKQSVLNKASDEKLNRDQAQAVAEAYRDASTPEVRAQVLKTPIISRDTTADILRRSLHRVEIESGAKILTDVNEWDRDQEEKRTMQRFNFAVKEFLDAGRLFLEVTEKGHSLVKYGKYSPEAARFAIRQIDKIMDSLKNYREELELVK